MKVKAEKPFAVLNFVTMGLDVLETELAKTKILVFGYTTTTEKALAQAPYRWGQTDTQALAMNAGEVVGKQFVDKPAEFGGARLQKQARKFGVVYIPNIIDIDRFKSDLKEYGGTSRSSTAIGNGSTLGEPTSRPSRRRPS